MIESFTGDNTASDGFVVPVLVPLPAHSRLQGALSYRSASPLTPGTLVRVPLGKRDTLGVVWDPPKPGKTPSPVDPTALRSVGGVLAHLAPLDAAWRALVDFAAAYYQRAPGEVALAALPPQLRQLDSLQLTRKLTRLAKLGQGGPAQESSNAAQPEGPALTPEQASALEQMAQSPGPHLLFGSTGSGKTEVYLRAVIDTLAADPSAQALVLVPEINLTPQLQRRFTERLQAWLGPGSVVSLHSGMTPAQRMNAWLAAHQGPARVVLGTRVAVFASLPRLRLIVVDEEHDPSYKQQEGARYSARDLAVLRGHQLCALASGDTGAGAAVADSAKPAPPARPACRVLLGSATPSLESWHHSRPGGRYQRLHMPQRVGADGPTRGLPEVRLIDMAAQPRGTVVAQELLQAIATCVAQGRQALVFLNRRGYAPVLTCSDCGWKSECPHCSAYRVFHKIDRTLRCHHCGFTQSVPRACPTCGNQDIRTLGRGTEQLQEQLDALLAPISRPGGGALRVARIDADTTRRQGALEQQLAAMHSGDVDVLVGTQMIAKGHDFRRVGLVAAVNPDAGLFSSDFRAPERLFALLMQAAGRAGRQAHAPDEPAQVLVQTAFPRHPLFAALQAHDYPRFAEQQLRERQQAGLPPFSHQALLRAEGRSQEVAQDFLRKASAAAAELPHADQVTRYPAVPMALQRVAQVERAQLLLESSSRQALQGFLSAWHNSLTELAHHSDCAGLLRWALDVDPLAI